MTPTLILAIAMMVVAIIVGSGGLAAFLKYHTRLVIVEKDAATTATKIEETGKALASNSTRVSLLEATLKDIRDSLAGLQVVHAIKSQVDVLTARHEDNRKEIGEVKTDLKVFMQSIVKER